MKQHKTPCAECPFRRASAAGWLGASSPQEFMDQARNELRMPCHLHIDYEQPDWEGQVPDAPRCAGHAIFLRNTCNMPRDRELADFVKTVERDSEKVFQWPQEFIKHHTR